MISRSRLLHRLIVGSLLTGTCIGATALAAFAEPSAANGAPSSSGAATGAPAARAGQWVHVDPQTGARTSATQGGVNAALSDPAFSTSHDGLVEEPAPGGGATINLQGRFRSAAGATVGADGKVKVGCHEPAAAPAKE
jgi:ABC-type transport system substrate-binding protein